MRILCISAQALFPETRFGGAKRLYYLVKALEARAEVDLLHMDGCEEVDDPSAFAPPFRRQLYIPRQTLSPLELGPVIPEASKALDRRREAVKAFLAARQYDATLLLFPAALYFLERGFLSHAGKIVYLEDDFFPERLRSEARVGGLLRRLLKRARLAQAKRFYRRNLAGVSGFVCISKQEAEIARSSWGLPTHLMGYGLPVEEFPRLPAPTRPHVLGFIGNYRHAPNLDAARWLAETLFPAVRARLPEARLVLAGAGLPEALRASLMAQTGVEVLGEVGDLAAFYERISVFVNPIREGRGLRTKVVEAAAYGRPVLSTRLGAEGLEAFELGLFETPEELSRRIEGLDAESGRTVTRHPFRGEDMIRLAVILLNYRNAQDTLACIASLARDPSPAKIFLVDNSSRDGSRETLREGLRASGMDHTYLDPGDNTGFAGGCNVGLRAAFDEGFTHAVLLNNDTLADPGFLNEVARCVEARPGEVLAGEVVDARTGKPSHNIGRISPLTGRVRHIFDSGYAGEIDFISGCLMILPREALERTGLFDERLFMYAEDLDLSWRLKEKGVRMRYCPSIRVRHKESSTVKSVGLPKEYYAMRNQTHVILRRGNALQKLLYGLALLTLPVYKAILFPRTWTQSVRGVFDGLTGRLGRTHASS
jgi:GT2 family glycosyltransferase/glycosyltransferase involved in cell wall biosynthesis